MQSLRQIAEKNIEKFERKIPNKQFLLGKFYEISKHQCKARKQKKFPKGKTGKLLQKQIQLSKLAQKPIKEQKLKIQSTILSYDKYIPLNKFWQRYINQLLINQNSPQSRQLKFLRADFHGANITIMDCRTSTCIGIQGIIIKQTLKTFEIMIKGSQIQKERVVTILKPISIFLFRTQNYNFIINGSSLTYRPSDRIKHKFKFKKAEDINRHFLEILEQVRKQ